MVAMYIAGSIEIGSTGRDRLPVYIWRPAVSLGWKETASGQKGWKRRVITGAIRHEVAEQLNTILGDQQRGISVDIGTETLDPFLTDWLEHTVKASVRPKTYRSYEQMMIARSSRNSIHLLRQRSFRSNASTTCAMRVFPCSPHKVYPLR